MQNIKVSVRSQSAKYIRFRPRRGSYNHFEIAKDKKRWYIVATEEEGINGGRHKNTQMVRQSI